ncbi:hypothetical protein ACO0LF_31165 [Undibacterium sp. Di27W]|uniref:hypothetical protein n=1 Tax=Undibacterium sp. Di27W TaxID=3413036 RepID=UPI003BF309F1
MNKKIPANNRCTTTKQVFVAGIGKEDMEETKLIDVSILEAGPEEVLPGYEADDGQIDTDYMEWMKDQAKSQMADKEVVFAESLLDPFLKK